MVRPDPCPSHIRRAASSARRSDIACGCRVLGCRWGPTRAGYFSLRADVDRTEERNGKGQIVFGVSVRRAQDPSRTWSCGLTAWPWLSSLTVPPPPSLPASTVLRGHRRRASSGDRGLREWRCARGLEHLGCPGALGHRGPRGLGGPTAARSGVGLQVTALWPGRAPKLAELVEAVFPIPWTPVDGGQHDHDRDQRSGGRSVLLRLGQA